MTELSKICETCGRIFEWRKKWETNWEHIKYCSKKCRSNKPGSIDIQLENSILTLCKKRGKHRSICPSEATKTVFEEADWKSQMERTRQAARRLFAKQKINITQHGKSVDPSTAKGPIRLSILN